MAAEARAVSCGGYCPSHIVTRYSVERVPWAEAEQSLLLIGHKRDDLSGSRVKDRSLGLGEIGELPFRKNGKPAGPFYYRFLYGYRPK